jgi:hypothetical protein
LGKIVIPYKPREQQKRMHSGMESRRFSVIVAHRRWGKTVCVVNHLIKQALLCTKIDPRYGYVAPFRNQGKQLAWLYLKRFTQVIPGVKINESELDVTLPNKAVIRIYGADNPDALRGMYFDGVVLDEVAQMKPEVWDEIVLPALADRKGWAVFIGTPKGINAFYEIYTKAVADPDLYYSDVFPVTGTDALDAEEVELQRSIQSENKFRQEYLCDFTASVEDALIPIDLVEKAYGKIIEAHAYKTQPIIFGVDVARFGDDKSVIYVRQGLATLEIKKYSGVDLFQFSETVMAKIKEHDPDAVFIDVVGVGAGVVDMIRSKGFGDCVSGINSGNRPLNSVLYLNKRIEMWARMKEWLELGGCIPADTELRVDLVSPLYSYDAANRMKLEPKEDMKKRGIKSPDLGDALALTFAQPVAKRKPAFLADVKSKYNPFDKLQQLRA